MIPNTSKSYAIWFLASFSAVWDTISMLKTKIGRLNEERRVRELIARIQKKKAELKRPSPRPVCSANQTLKQGTNN